MPKAFKISSYLGKDAEKILIQTRNMGAVLGASLPWKTVAPFCLTECNEVKLLSIDSAEISLS